MEQEGLKKRAETIAKIFRDKIDTEDSSLLFTELIDNEFFDNRLNFEESLQVVSYAIAIIKNQKPRTKHEKMMSITERSNEYQRDVYLSDDLTLRNGYVKSMLSDICRSEGVDLSDYINYLKKDQK